MLSNLIVVIISLSIHLSKHYVVQLKLNNVMFQLVSIKLGKTVNAYDVFCKHPKCFTSIVITV